MGIADALRSRSPAAAAAGALLAVVLLAGCGAAPEAPTQARPVLVVPVGASTSDAPSLAGEVRARHEAQLGFQVGGRVTERLVEVGEHVERGQVLARLEPDDLQARERAAVAQLAAAEAELGRARADQARYRALAREQLVSRSAMDTQDAAATAAQGQVDAARAELDVARNQAGHADLRAPADGVVAARHAEAGQVVAAGQAVFTLAGDGDREVVFPVSEARAGAIQPGDRVEVELWAGDGRRWAGEVREVAPAADPVSRTYQVRATVDAPADALGLGQSARVHLADTGAAPLTVPLSALQPGADGAMAVFVVRADSTLELRPVEIAAYGAERVPVLGGLQAGEWVVAAGGHLLREGEQVRPVDRQARTVEIGQGTPRAGDGAEEEADDKAVAQ